MLCRTIQASRSTEGAQACVWIYGATPGSGLSVGRGPLSLSQGSCDTLDMQYAHVMGSCLRLPTLSRHRRKAFPGAQVVSKRILRHLRQNISKELLNPYHGRVRRVVRWIHRNAGQVGHGDQDFTVLAESTRIGRTTHTARVIHCATSVLTIIELAEFEQLVLLMETLQDAWWL